MKLGDLGQTNYLKLSPSDFSEVRSYSVHGLGQRKRKGRKGQSSKAF